MLNSICQTRRPPINMYEAIPSIVLVLDLLSMPVLIAGDGSLQGLSHLLRAVAVSDKAETCNAMGRLYKPPVPMISGLILHLFLISKRCL